MTIEKGQEWGTLIPRPTTVRNAATDAEVARLWAEHPDEPILLSGGDLYRSLGSPPERDPVMRLPLDLLRVTLDSGVTTAAAHVVMRNRWWRGRILAVVNSDHVGEWNVAPRAHPNDGRLDVVDVAAEMGWRQRWQARQRVTSGTHLPHRFITVSTAAEVAFEFDKPMRAWVDGQVFPPTRHLSVTVLPDAAIIIA